MSCAAVYCSSRTTKQGVKDPELSFHTFPKCPEVRREWIRAVRRDGWEPTKYSRLCSKHFEKSCFIDGLSIRRLKTDAVPTIFEGYPHYYQSVTRKRKPRQTISEIHNITPRKRKKMQEGGVSTEAEDIPSTPRRAVKILTALSKSRIVAARRLKTIKKLRENKRRLVKKNASLLNVINDLKAKNLVDTESVDLLSSIGNKNKDLLVRLQCKHSNKALPKKYSPELRKFALTLHFLSPKAYRYVRSNFESCLPHPKTISKWYQSVDCEPGFTKESFEALKIKCLKQPIIGALCIDEMAIRKCVQWDGQRSHGYVNIGNNVQDDSAPLATEVLTFMMTAVNASFKIPVGYFLINGITGLQKAELVRTCLNLLAETGVKIVTLTFDGAPNNIAMAKILGCSLDKDNFTTHFIHNDLKINILFDPCHCLKLVRNTLGDQKIIYNKDGKEICFKYFELLHNLQTQEQLHLANKLRRAHIEYIKQKMKVKLAAQTLSQSVCDALMFCKNNVKLEEFADCEATCEFISIFNNVFDLLNSRNLNAYGFKQAILPRNLDKTYRLIDEVVIYYISGFVVKKIKKKLVCENCLSALEGPKKSSLTYIKDKGGLIYPSDDVYYICKLSEKVIRKTLICTHHSKIDSKKVYEMIREVILETMNSSNYQLIFESLNEHVAEYSFFEDHKYLLIKSICEIYLQLRIHFVMKNAVVENSVRNMYTKLILFKGH